MGTVLRFYFALNLLAVFLSIHSCISLWKRRHSELGRVSFWLMLAVTFWLVPYVLILWVEDLNTAVFFFKLGYIGALSLPVTWLMYAIFLIGKESWLTRKRIVPLIIIAGFFLILVVTDQFWKNASLVRLDWLSTLEVEFTDWLIPYMVFTYTLDGLGVLFILWSVVRSPRKNLWRGLTFAVGALFPILANVEFFFGLIPGLELDLTPFSILFPVLIIIWGTFRYQWFDVVPVARDALVDRVTDGMVVIDTAGRVLDLNLAARHILGKPMSEARLKLLVDLLPEMGSLAAGKNELMVQRFGQLAYYEIGFSPINNRDGALAGTLVMLHDITERKQGELQLQEALGKEKAVVEAKSRFVAVASHAFRTPLTTIQSSAQLLETYFERWPEQKRKDHLARIRESVSGLVHLIQRMLAFEEIQSGKIHAMPVEMDLVDLCLQATHDLTRELVRPLVRFEKHGQDFRVFQDKDLLYQVVLNLLSNAFKYSPPDKPVVLELWMEKQSAVIEVRDEGIGIPAVDLPHLGEAFYRGSNAYQLPGSGLGLLIVNQALQLIGGHLQVNPLNKKAR